MKTRLTEETVLFVSVVKWVLLASGVGAAVGLSTTLFLKVLNWSTAFTGQYGYFFLLVPVALFLSSLVIRYLAPDAEGHGTEKVIEAIHKRAGRIKAAVVPVKLVATVITIAAGGSAGKEGPCAQIGGGLASLAASLMRLDDHDRKILVICGISAGFAAVFGTPISGAIFGVEVLFVGTLLYDVLLPSFIAGITSYQISSGLGMTYFHHPLEFVPVFSEAFFAKIVVAGVCFGVCSVFLVETLQLGRRLSARFKVWPPLKGLIGGLALVALALIFSRRYMGLGLTTIQSALQGEKIIWAAFILKAIFTSITLNFGGSGGIVTPIFFVGATFGALFGQIFGLDVATFAGLGLVGLLAGAANTPISASIMAVELFGPKLAPYAAVACVVSFLMTGHRSVYPSQVLAMRKSSSLEVEIGKEMEDLTALYHPRPKSVTAVSLRAWQSIKGKLFHRAKPNPGEGTEPDKPAPTSPRKEDQVERP
jgi:H+/Cl- antiporter ClcA